MAKFKFGNVVERTTTSTLTSDLVLTISDAQIQFLTPDASGRTVTLPDEPLANGIAFIIANNSTLYSIIVKDDGGNTIDTVAVETFGTFVSDGTTFLAQAGAASGGGGSIEIQDEGALVDATVTKLNFVGEDVIAAADSGDNDLVNVYIPAPSVVSHFDSSDGVGDCTVGDISTTSRRISSPTSEGSPFNIGDWSGNTLHNAIKVSEATVSYTTTNACSFLNNLNTTIEVNIYDADGVVKLATHTTASIVGNTDVTVDNIRIQVTSWAADAYKYKGIVTVSFNIGTVLTSNGLTSGRFSTEIIHHDSTDGDFTYTQGDIFYDSESQTQTIGNATISENVPVIVRKSGVYAYDTGTTFTVNIDDLDYLNADTYPTNFITLTGSEYGLPSYSIDGSDADLSGWTDAYNNINTSFNKDDWTINQSNFYVRSSTRNITAQVIDWSTGASDVSPNASLIIDTYNDNSTRVYEDFRGETERLEDDLSTPWDSTLSLASADDSQGLQVGEGTYLYYPYLNNSGYEPSSGSQFDYSSLTGDRYYYRGMWHTNTAHSNGTFNMTGVTETNLTNDDIIIEISLDGSSWYNCNEDYLGGALSNGNGCRVNSGSTQMPNLDFTLGTGGNTAVGTGPGWGIWIKITMPDTSTVKMNLIQISNWT